MSRFWKNSDVMRSEDHESLDLKSYVISFPFKLSCFNLPLSMNDTSYKRIPRLWTRFRSVCRCSTVNHYVSTI